MMNEFFTFSKRNGRPLCTQRIGRILCLVLITFCGFYPAYSQHQISNGNDLNDQLNGRQFLSSNYEWTEDVFRRNLGQPSALFFQASVDSIGNGEPYLGYDSLCVDTDPPPTCTSNDFTSLEVYLASDTLGTRLADCTLGSPTNAFVCFRFDKGNGSTRQGFYISATIAESDTSTYEINHCFDMTLQAQGEYILCIPDQVITFNCGSAIESIETYFGWGSSAASSNICNQTSGCASPKCDFTQGGTPVSSPLVANFSYEITCPGADTVETLVLTDLTTGGIGSITYDWDFDDGQSSTLQNPSYTYGDSGDYNVQLIVTDSLGTKDTLVQAIRIDSCSTLSCLIVGGLTMCSGDSLILTENGIGADQWSWSGPNSFSATTKQIVRFPVDTSMSGIYKVVVSNKYGGMDSCEVVVDITDPIVDSLNYIGCEGDNYSISVGMNLYNEANPSGTDTLSSVLGCDSIVITNLVFHPVYRDTIEYDGCEGDGYSIMVGSTTYNEANPSGIDTFTTVNGCDSIIVTDLDFNLEAVVEAGALPGPVCSDSPIYLNDLAASITGGTTEGMWTTMGSGSFDNGGAYGGSMPATVYNLSTDDINNGQVILTLTSVDPPGSCEPMADAVLVYINDISCSAFPFSGNE